jgi:hypothetical protein
MIAKHETGIGTFKVLRTCTTTSTIKDPSHLRCEYLGVQNNTKTTGKRPGGITGKGFMPGKSGNPGGRPKKRPISDRYADLAEQPLPDDLRLMMKLEKGATWGDALALSQFRGAIKGKPEAAREIREAIEGKATQRLEVSGQEGGSVKLDLAATLQKLHEAYGLRTQDAEAAEVANSGNGGGTAQTSHALPISGEMDRGPEPPEDRGQE